MSSEQGLRGGMIGSTISHYRVIEQLGAGGMGVVYKAEDTRLDRLVALKFLATHLTSDEQVKRRFIREAKASAALDHPNVCTVYEVDEVDGQTFIAMTYLEGESLEERIREGPLTIEEVLNYATQIAQGLKAAHLKDIVHRDIKPGNIMLCTDGYLKIMDFGLALLSNRSRLTQSDTTVGTPAYMSPEQARGQAADFRTDIWSLGVVIYEMIVGRPPFDSPYQQAIVYSILNEEPEPVTALRTGVPMRLEWVCDKCLEKDSNDRYQSTTELTVDLGGITRQVSTGKVHTMQTGPQPSVLRTLLAPSSQSAKTSGKKAQSGWDSKLSAVVVAVAIIGIIIGAAAGIVFSPASGPPPYESTQLTFDDGLTFEPSISRDGTLVAYASDRSENDLDIWVQQSGGGRPLRLTNHPADDHEPHFSPDGQNIVFRSERDGGGVYVVPALGGQPRLIAPRGWRPRYSPDGQYIAFHDGPAGSAGDVRTPGSMVTFVVDANGGNRRQAPKDFDVAGFPMWAQDSEHLVVWGCPRGKLEDFGAWKVSLGGGEPEQLYQGSVIGTQDWSADNDLLLVYPRKFGVLATLRNSNWDDLRNNKLRPITQGTDRVWSASRAETGVIAYSPVDIRVDLWRLALEAGAVPSRITNDFARESQPVATTNGEYIAYRAERSGSDLWLSDMTPEGTRRLTVGAEDEHWPVLNRDGSNIYFRIFDTERRRQVFRVAADGSPPTLLGPDIGNMTAVTADERYLLGMQRIGGRMALIAFDQEIGTSATLAAHEEMNIYSPRLSPDDKWICFQTRHADDSVQVYVAPFDAEGDPLEESDWIRITRGRDRNRKAIFSAQGDAVFYVSDRDGFDCIWKQKLAAETRLAVGEPVAVRHFHQSTTSLTHVGEAEQQLAVGGNSLIYNAAEISGNVWLMTPRE